MRIDLQTSWKPAEELVLALTESRKRLAHHLQAHQTQPSVKLSSFSVELLSSNSITEATSAAELRQAWLTALVACSVGLRAQMARMLTDAVRRYGVPRVVSDFEHPSAGGTIMLAAMLEKSSAGRACWLQCKEPFNSLTPADTTFLAVYFDRGSLESLHTELLTDSQRHLIAHAAWVSGSLTGDLSHEPPPRSDIADSWYTAKWLRGLRRHIARRQALSLVGSGELLPQCAFRISENTPPGLAAMQHERLLTWHAHASEDVLASSGFDSMAHSLAETLARGSHSDIADSLLLNLGRRPQQAANGETEIMEAHT